ncbi:MAG: SDR family oxidoreductase [Prosthecobacter sp.]|jgi:NAD(P)-dependent dehydrogenase (short-subunit alcohol dehydrogenase family)|nr:SDR family oxidoreductase [Prosthecobacter sp.]
MDLQLSGQHVAIFGSSQGIGRAIAQAFQREGCLVRGFDRVAGEGIETTVGDVASWSEVSAFAASFPRIHHMVYCVGVSSGKFGFPFWNLDPSDWARVLDLNLTGAVRAAHAFAPGLIAAGGGSMLFLVSVAGQIGSQTDPPYSAAKAGLINFTQCAAKDLAKHRVRVNALSPGMVKTDLNQAVWAASQQQIPEAQRQDYETWASEKIAKVAPLGCWQTPEEYGSMACYLASHHARNMTGQTINIDGGQVMHA